MPQNVPYKARPPGGNHLCPARLHQEMEQLLDAEMGSVEALGYPPHGLRYPQR